MKKKRILCLAFILLIGSMNLNAASIGKNTGQCTNPYHLLVNKEHSLSSSYKPTNLVIPNVNFQSPGNIEKNYMEATAAKALEEMFNAAKAQNIRLVAVSGYRSYSRQSTLYKNAISAYGRNQQGTAKPGQSEHQTGLAMDLNSISQSFQYTKEGKWVAQNAHLYGFIIRYPKGKTDITGYIYEPWHIRYVGKELAAYCFTNNLTLEEIADCCSQDEEVEMAVQMAGQTESVNYPLIKRKGVTYIKARDLITILGGRIEFLKGILTLESNNHILSLTEKSLMAQLNGEIASISYEPVLVNQSFYVPIRGTLKLMDYDLNLINEALVISKSPVLTDIPEALDTALQEVSA